MPSAGVAAGHPLTAQAAVDILHAGGNAFDAAIAAVATACVCEPVLASPGGGGFLTALCADGETRAYDFFVQTPRRKNRDGESFYPVEVDFGDATQSFHIGLGSSATPGLIKGLFDIHRDLGRMPLSEVFEAAVHHARNGVEINTFQASLLSIVAPIYVDTAPARQLFCSDSDTNQLLADGDRAHFPQLADLLDTLAIEGEDLFYRGEIAAAVAEQCASGGGHLQRDDFSDYQTTRSKPLSISYRGHRFVTQPPPSAGGLLICFALKLLEAGLHAGTDAGSIAHLRTLTKVMQFTGKARLDREIAEAEGRSLDLLDSEFVDMYRQSITEHSTALRGTTHISVIDRQGNHAALTVSNGEGCGHIVPGGGFMLNNMLGEDDLNPAGFGNWRCDQRMISMMAPSVLQHSDGRRSWALGSGGSNRIRSAILQVLSNLVDFDHPVEIAVESPRIHLEENLLSIEQGFDDSIVDQLIAHYQQNKRWRGKSMFFGGAHTLERDPAGNVSGAGDTRRGGCFIPA